MKERLEKLNEVLEKIHESVFPANISWANKKLYLQGLDEALEEYELVKRTKLNYCASCLKEFENGEVVYFIVVDNNCVCNECNEKIHAKFELRVFRK